MNRLAMFALLLFVSVFGLSMPSSAYARSSFPCARAHGADEIAICHSPALRRLDGRMDAMYRDILGCSGMGSRDVYREQQRIWITRRRACQSDEACITRLYDRWIRVHRARAAKSHRLLPRGDCPF